MKVIIDRFEGDFAVVDMDNNEFVNIPKVLLPNLSAVGDIIEKRDSCLQWKRMKIIFTI